MNHAEIDEREIVEHYVAGKLTAQDAARFEEHYLGCPTCIRAIEDAERLKRGLETVAAQDLAARRSILAAAWRNLRSRPGAILVPALLLAILLPVFAWQRALELDTELEAARRELAEERRPRINTPILTVVPTRAGEQPVQQISMAPEPEWVVLAIELGDTAEPLYHVRLLASADNAVVWESPSLEPSYRGTLTFSLFSSLLPPGEYVLSLEGETQRWRFPLRIVPLSASP